MPEHADRRTLRAIAVFEAVKGVLALAALAGVLDLMHHDVRQLAIELIGRFGLPQGGRFPTMLLHYADMVGGADARMVVMLGLGYVAIRLVEAWGLWFDRSWGELFGALSGALYVPFEVQHIIHRPTVTAFAVLAVNLFLIGYLLLTLRRKRMRRAAAGA
ncbi:MAG: DUF2127 domain-containing protein [Comamonadaceae bacterium]|nr:MAG: DUF2127 domain-containing protein [Comamonadaceae bacterium]